MNYSRFKTFFPSTAFARRHIADDVEKTEYRELKAQIHGWFFAPLILLVREMHAGKREWRIITVVHHDRIRWPVVQIAPDLPGLITDPDPKDVAMEKDLIAELRELTFTDVRWKAYGVFRQVGTDIDFIPARKKQKKSAASNVVLFSPASWNRPVEPTRSF